LTPVRFPELADADVVELARLCRLELSPVDTDLGRQYLTTIVALLARLQEVDVSDAPPDVAAERVEALHDPLGAVAATDPVTNDGARPDDWSRWTAWDTAEAVRRGEVSALELTQAALARVAAVDGLVHAWLSLDERGALAAARAVDAARARGDRPGPLAGVPTRPQGQPRDRRPRDDRRLADPRRLDPPARRRSRPPACAPPGP
jgi:Asp-tRNA(Asn)/Glu-tRNA(Gln) amidotransferase C subunit